MRKILVISLFLMVVMAMGAMASLSVPSEVTVGSSAQPRSNPDADDVADQNVYASAEFTITNSGATAVNITDITFPTDAKYNITVSPATPFKLNAGSSQKITVRSRIPEDLASFFKNDPDQVKDTIGTIQFTVVNAANKADVETASVPLALQADNFLVIDKVYIKVNELSQKSYDANDKVEDLKPGDTLELTVRVENKYNDRDPENLDFSDGTIEIVAREDNFDIDDDQDLDVNANEKDDITFDSVDIDYDADQDDVLVVTVYAEDDNGALQGEQIEIELELNQDNDEIAIIDLDDTVALQCGESSVGFSFTLVNIGEDDNDEIEVKVTSTDFSYQDRRKDINLDAGDDIGLSYNIPVPSGITSGNKIVTVTTYYDRIKQSHEESLFVSVPSCQPVVEEEEEPDTSADDQNDVEVVVQPPRQEEDNDEVVIPPIIAGAGNDESVEAGFTDSSMFTIILIVAIVIAVGALVLVIVLLSKPRH